MTSKEALTNEELASITNLQHFRRINSKSIKFSLPFVVGFSLILDVAVNCNQQVESMTLLNKYELGRRERDCSTMSVFKEGEVLLKN